VNSSIGARVIDDGASKLGMLTSDLRALAAALRQALEAPRSGRLTHGEKSWGQISKI
jgi:hypothetical protein